MALGSVRLIKTEDSGLFYFDDAQGQIQPPDFRIVLNDGAQLLVEVKNIAPIGNGLEAKIRAADVTAAQAYAQATGGRLLYALFWSRMRMWTLVDPSTFRLVGKYQRLSATDAAMANEMHLLGDGHLATEPPLTFSVVMNRDQERVVERLGEGEETRALTIGGVELLAAGRIITAPDERRLAWFLMLHGGWSETQTSHFDDEGRLERLDYVFAPDLPDDVAVRQMAEQGFAFLDTLSTLYTRQFLEAVTTEDGEIRALREEPEPAVLAQLIPDSYWERKHRVLRIWRFQMQPAIDTAPPVD
ncbi:hypothetical protein KCMC57_up26450 [Kitasatospora sp. CMC57]|uniref:Restriction endonuclease n=1 Tax=Kitasatospora sp. CMC57 TaxID=3231513 RepID=A0AB33K473_9ACTN